MYKNKRFLALLPARSGSKGSLDKNIRTLGSKPLLAWSIDAAKDCKSIDRLIVSTDSEKYAKIAKAHGAQVPFIRPANLAIDKTSMMDVIVHAMQFIEKAEGPYDYLVLLQPTSPFRTNRHLQEAIELLFSKDAQVILGVQETEHSPLICNTLPSNKNMNGFIDKHFRNKNRQELPQYYRLNGAIYIASWPYLKKTKDWFGERTFAYVMDRKSSVDIDSDEDFLSAQGLLGNKRK
jgi:N-acylneuraminate cytidylyltransferase/CMP-N,N'-diacetyllegionaminic acid synthase